MEKQEKRGIPSPCKLPRDAGCLILGVSLSSGRWLVEDEGRRVAESRNVGFCRIDVIGSGS